MTFINSIKRAFGFGEADFDSDIDNSDGLLSDDERPQSGGGATSSPQASAPDSLPAADSSPAIDESRKQAIFESVAKLFNDSLPAFIASSIDPEKQRQNIYNALDESLKAYLDSLADDARRHAELSLQGRQEAVKSEMEKLKTDVHMLEQQRSAIKEQQLSSDRRRRALTDRVRDLEEQLARLEAEREQFELENKSLLNKIKVSEIQPGIVDSLQAEVKRLTQELEKSSAAAAEAPDAAAAAADSEALGKLRAENKALGETNTMLAEQHRSSLAVINGLQHDIVGLKQELAEAKSSLEEARAGLEDAEQLRAQVEDARRLSADIETFRSQLAQVEQLIAKRDERIARLKSSNKNLKARLAELESIATSASTEAPAKYGGGKVEKGKHRGEPSLFDDSELALGAEAHGTPLPGAISADDLAEIDDDFEAVDWLVSSPPEGTVLRPNPNDPEFGYHEPPRRPTPPENDAQLSLF